MQKMVVHLANKFIFPLIYNFSRFITIAGRDKPLGLVFMGSNHFVAGMRINAGDSKYLIWQFYRILN